MNTEISPVKGGLHSVEAALLPVRLFPSVGYYAIMNRYPEVAFDTCARYNKAEKGTHRFTIADTRGELRLTVPVSRPSGTTLWKEVLVSDHGRWWETMPIALESAYGRTPCFEFYIDRFMPLFTPDARPVTELCLEADALVRSILCMPAKIVEAEEGRAFHSYTDADFESLSASLPPYWQVRADSLGFLPKLSILDLLFNLGPEAQLYLDRLSTSGVDNC